MAGLDAPAIVFFIIAMAFLFYRLMRHKEVSAILIAAEAIGGIMIFLTLVFILLPPVVTTHYPTHQVEVDQVGGTSNTIDIYYAYNTTVSEQIPLLSNYPWVIYIGIFVYELFVIILIIIDAQDYMTLKRKLRGNGMGEFPLR